MRDATPFIVFGIIALVFGIQLYIRHKAMQAKGQSVSVLHSLFPDFPSEKRALVFCHSPGCAPCKAMLPQISGLAQSHPHVYTLDISQHLDLAKEIGIRATPTILLIEGGAVSQVLIGQKKPELLQDFLEGNG